jgi:hypothetical protein
MATDWKFKAEYIKNCNCAPGCPCDFWAPPTYGTCEGLAGFRVLSGYYGDVDLAGVIFMVALYWPGPLHLGNGTFQAYVGENASEAQRNAILRIMSGREGGPWMELNAALVAKVHKPKFLPIRWEFDLERRRARVVIGDEAETLSEPIRTANGVEHRVRISMPDGIEYKDPEIAVASVLRSTGTLKFDFQGGHSSLAIVTHTPKGLV